MSNPYWSDIVRDLDPYVPGEQPTMANLVKLNTNENPYGPSPEALAAIAAESGDNLRLYPDPNAMALKQTIADYYRIDGSQVFLGNGSDEVLAHIFQGLLKHGSPILFPDITYSFYPVYCGLYQVPYERVPLAEDFSIDVTNYCRENGGIIFPNPNAPTGVLMSLDKIDWLLKKNADSVVVIDEAYIDFGGESAISLVNHYPNLLVTQTLSKSRSLAGLRIGLAVGDAALIEALERVKNSFNSYPLSRLAIVGGVAAFKDDQYFQATCRKVIDSREKLVAQLGGLGFDTLPSAANFILTRHPKKGAAKLMSQLRARGIIVRYFSQPRIDQYLRITVGTPEQNAQLIAALNELVSD
ncbi:MAG: histidinol-phosphate transaminase [Gammaproteobacteria bacterium]|nr:MAG: histidinol-phosphate transaminase [Gammaproteobacteria bacterium]